MTEARRAAKNRAATQRRSVSPPRIDAAIAVRVSDRGPDRRAAAILTAEIKDGKRLGSADDPGVRAAAFRADFALHAGRLRGGAPRLGSTLGRNCFWIHSLLTGPFHELGRDGVPHYHDTDDAIFTNQPGGTDARGLNRWISGISPWKIRRRSAPYRRNQPEHFGGAASGLPGFGSAGAMTSTAKVPGGVAVGGGRSSLRPAPGS